MPDHKFDLLPPSLFGDPRARIMIDVNFDIQLKLHKAIYMYLVGAIRLNNILSTSELMSSGT